MRERRCDRLASLNNEARSDAFTVFLFIRSEEEDGENFAPLFFPGAVSHLSTNRLTSPLHKKRHLWIDLLQDPRSHSPIFPVSNLLDYILRVWASPKIGQKRSKKKKKKKRETRKN